MPRSVAELPMARWLTRFVAVAAVLYLAAAALLFVAQRSILFHPRPLQMRPAVPELSFDDGGARIRCWVADPGQPHALLYFGGNGESVEYDVDRFRGRIPGTSVYLCPYRGYSGTPGSPSEAALFSDALALFDLAHQRHAVVDVMGRSLGSGVAVYVAANRPVRRMLLVTPYDSIVNVAEERYPMFPVALLIRDRFESWKYARKVRADTRILAGEKDRVILRARTDRLDQSFPMPVPIQVFPGAGHNNIAGMPQYWPTVAAFFGRD
jgi:pimeloyl-ACP methyl ester carboxylesterase